MSSRNVEDSLTQRYTGAAFLPLRNAYPTNSSANYLSMFPHSDLQTQCLMSFHCTIQCYVILDTGSWAQSVNVININIIKLLPILQQFEKEKRYGYFQTIFLYRKNFCPISGTEIYFQIQRLLDFTLHFLYAWQRAPRAS